MDDRYFGIVMDGEPWYPKGNPWAVHYSGETNGNYFLDALRRQGEATRQTIQRAKAAEEMKRRAASVGIGLGRNNPFQQTEKTDAIKDYAEPANRQTHAKKVEKTVPINNARKARNRENQTIMYDRNNPPSAKEQLAATHTNMDVSSLTENEALDYLRYEGAKEQRNYLEREAERNAWYQPENIRNILGYINPVYSAANFFVNPANESLVRRGSKLATSLVPIGVSNMMRNNVAPGLSASNLTANSAPTTGQFLKQMAIDTPFMYAGAETTDALTRALTPFDSWAQGVSNATGLPEWVTEFSNPGMAWGPGVARGLAGSIVDGSIKNSVENVIQSRSLGKPSETAINELFPVGNPQVRGYNPSTQKPPAIRWDEAAMDNNNMGIFSLCQRENFGVNDIRYNYVDGINEGGMYLNPDGTYNIAQAQEDAQRGMQAAIDFLNSDIKAASDAHNIKLAQRLGWPNFTPYKGGANRASVPIKPEFVEKITDGDVVLGGTVERFRDTPELDKMKLDLTFNAQNEALHENLHRAYFGEADPTPFNPKSGANYWEHYNKRADTEALYTFKTNKLLAPRTAENAEWVDYLGNLNGGEAATNAMEIGARMGLKPGAPWPGKNKAMELFNSFSTSNDPKTNAFNALNWKQKPRRIWDALTGRYFAYGGGITTASIFSTDKNN